MIPFFKLYPQRKANLNISERISMTCIHLEGLLNQLEPEVVISQHLPSLKQALFHSHTKVVQVAVKQFLRLASSSKHEQLSEDMEVVLGLIENLAHKEQRVARHCVQVLLLLSSSYKSLMNLLCSDITDVLKTIMTYVAVRLLVYEFIIQLSINSSVGIQKSHTCGILEDVINDFKKKESYLTCVHYYQLHQLATTEHGHSYLVKYDALETVPKQCPEVPRESISHLITVVPEMTDTEKEQLCEKRTVGQVKQSRGKSQSPAQSCLNPASDHSSAHHSYESLRDDSSSSVSSPCDSLEARDLVSDSSGRSFTPPPPLQSPTPSHQHHHHHHHHHHVSNSGLSRLVSKLGTIPPHEMLTQHPDCLQASLRALQSADWPTILLGLHMYGYIGSSIHGKRLLYKLSKKDKSMTVVMRKLLGAILNLPTEEKPQAINIFHSLINVSEPNSKYEKITRKWFRQMWKPADLMKIIVSLCQKPGEEIRVAAYRVVRGLARQEWGQHYIRSRKELIEMLLTASDESQSIYDVKLSVLEILTESPTIGKTFKVQLIDRIKTHISKCKQRCS